VPHPSAAHEAGQKATTVAHAAVVLDQTGQPSVDAVVEAFDFVGGVVFHFAQVNERFNDGAVSPDIGPAQIVHAQDLNVFEGHSLARCVSGESRGESRGRHGQRKGCGDTIICHCAGVQQSLGSCFLFFQ